MELKKKTSWRDVSINEYYDITDIIEDDSLEPYDKEVKLIAFINNMTDDEVWALNINEFRELQVKAMWLYEFDFRKNTNFKNIKINNEKYTIDINLQHFTVAQYIDFQTFWPKTKTNMREVIGNVLACFIIPKGHKYNDGYDITSVIEDIKDNIDIMTANEIMFFFLSTYQTLMRIFLNYSHWKIKRMMKRKKHDNQVNKMLEQVEQIERAISDGFTL